MRFGIIPLLLLSFSATAATFGIKDISGEQNTLCVDANRGAYACTTHNPKGSYRVEITPNVGELPFTPQCHMVGARVVVAVYQGQRFASTSERGWRDAIWTPLADEETFPHQSLGCGPRVHFSLGDLSELPGLEVYAGLVAPDKDVSKLSDLQKVLVVPR